ncbi:diablo, IAP-binding mitochondrial protein b [Danio rerio]|uniref:Direct IAP-binding protein with low pI n=2 Tax=Danio rerio TaxID=7955 RepID=A0A8M1NZ47_DANRE|nr:diablo, IAP-binding mitochondrial protein b [Danio rerio]|eukprot:NP_001229963.1 diablo homolog, mitochondrial [Danio rerio]
MAAYRRKLFAAGLSYAASLLSSGGSCQAGRRLFLLPGIFRKHWRTLSVTGAICAVPFLQKPENLSHEDLVRRASSLVTDSANTFLSQTTLALIDSFTGYIKAVNILVELHKQYEASISKFTPEEENAIWKVILGQRQEVIGRRKNCTHFESCWMTAVNLSQQAAEAAFNAGADQASVAAQSSLQVAQSQVEQVKQLMLEAEIQLKDSKAEYSERLQVALSEDEDIPDAYLRED